MMGSLSAKITDAVLESLPVDITVVDYNDKVAAWNKHKTRLFPRDSSALNHDVRTCHPKKSIDAVTRILEEMKAKKRDSAEFWIDMKTESGETEKVYILYVALRDEEGYYLGCLEVTQRLERLQSLSGEKRLLD